MAKLSIMPNWFGEFGGCVFNINWGYLVRPTIRHNARWGIEKRMEQENSLDNSVRVIFSFKREKGSLVKMFLRRGSLPSCQVERKKMFNQSLSFKTQESP